MGFFLFEEQLPAFQVEAFGSEGSGDLNSGNVLTWAQPLLKFAKDNFLPLGDALSRLGTHARTCARTHIFQSCESWN